MRAALVLALLWSAGANAAVFLYEEHGPLPRYEFPAKIRQSKHYLFLMIQQRTSELAATFRVSRRKIIPLGWIEQAQQGAEDAGAKQVFISYLIVEPRRRISQSLVPGEVTQISNARLIAIKDEQEVDRLDYRALPAHALARSFYYYPLFGPTFLQAWRMPGAAARALTDFSVRVYDKYSAKDRHEITLDLELELESKVRRRFNIEQKQNAAEILSSLYPNNFCERLLSTLRGLPTTAPEIR